MSSVEAPWRGSPEITSRLSTARSRTVTLVALTLRRPGSRVARTADGEPAGSPSCQSVKKLVPFPDGLLGDFVRLCEQA